MAEQCCSKDIRYDSGDTTNKRKSVDSIDSTEKKMKNDIISSQLRQCSRLLYDFRHAKTHLEYTHVFLYPVDVELYQCPDYYQVIDKPMDLSTMQKKMDNNEYKTPADFAADIRLIIQNCLTYNSSDHEIVPMCEKFKTEFETRFNKIMNPRKRNILSPVPPDVLLRRSSRSMVLLPDDKDALLKEISRTQEYQTKLIEKLKNVLENEKKVGNRQNAKAAPKKRGRKKSTMVKTKNDEEVSLKLEETFQDSENTVESAVNIDSDEEMLEPLTYDQKRELVQKLNTLPGDKLEEVRKIIQRLEPECYSKTGESCEIDFEACTTKTLRELEKFVKEIFFPKVQRAIPFPRKAQLEKNKELVKIKQTELELEKVMCEKRLANIDERLGIFMRKKVEEPQPTASQSSSSSSGSSSSDSSSTSDSDSDSN